MVARICNPISEEAEAGLVKVQIQPGILLSLKSDWDI